MGLDKLIRNSIAIIKKAEFELEISFLLKTCKAKLGPTEYFEIRNSIDGCWT